MTKIIGSLVMKNEEDRYLESCLTWALSFLDEVFVYDDRSTDNSVDIARSIGCKVAVRAEDDPSFISHEGEFRFNAWKAFCDEFPLDRDTWILSFDADEFLVDSSGQVRDSLEKAVGIPNIYSVSIPFAEIFKVDDGKLYERVDGLWGTIRGTRLFRFQENASWKNKKMGCGAEPLYVSQSKISSQNFGLTVIHLGYAKDEDKKLKFDRYENLADHGHNDNHIQSILQTPTLREWNGMLPRFDNE